jgi:nitrogen fixation NifU-like protein
MSDLRDLYQQIIIDHSRNPRNFRTLPGANRVAQGYNPLCGDKLTLYLQVEDGRISAATFEGSGCAISQASASLMTSAIVGQSTAAAERLLDQFHDMIAGGPNAPTEPAKLGKLGAFAGVKEFPARVKCATLCWHALRAALQSQANPVSTE